MRTKEFLIFNSITTEKIWLILGQLDQKSDKPTRDLNNFRNNYMKKILKV